MRESPTLELTELPEEKGAIVHYTDPLVLGFLKMLEQYIDHFNVKTTLEFIHSYDRLLLASDQAKFDYVMFRKLRC